MNRSLLKSCMIFVLLASACNAREEPPARAGAEPAATATQAAPGSASGDPSVVHHPEPPQRPAQKQDSIQSEGSWERITATLVQPASSIPFSTYLPPDMIFERTSADEGEGYYFYTNFGGRRNDHAFMLVFILPQGKTSADAQTLANAMVASRTAPRMLARAQLGEYNGRPFYVARVYPQEFGDGMGPRTHYIRSQWIWHNDGRSLEATLQPQPE